MTGIRFKRFAYLFLFAQIGICNPELQAQNAIATQGCPKAHCGAGNSDWSNMQSPSYPVDRVWYRNELPGEVAGSDNGLGCSANGTHAVCTFRGTEANVASYDFDGNRVWHSGTMINEIAASSVPLMLDNGDVIIGDNLKLYRFDSGGGPVWSTVLSRGGLPISPVMTQSGIIILGCFRGPVYAIDAETGNILSYKFIRSGSDTGFYDTQNTPAVVGDRVYIFMQHKLNGGLDPDYIGALVAIDVDASIAAPADRLQVAWLFEFGAQSNSSPLVIDDVVMFDGARPEPGVSVDPHIFGIIDQGANATELWRRSPPRLVFASFSADPRGGFWHFMTGSPIMPRRDIYTGNVIEKVNVDLLVGEIGVHMPSSAMTFSGTVENPVLTLGVAAPGGDSYVVAVDLAVSTLRWKYRIAPAASESPQGQYPLLTDGVDVRTVFSTDRGGVRAIGSTE